MDETEFFDLMKALQNVGESERIEAKRAEHSSGKSLLDTISAFSNEPGLGGGYLVLGLTKNSSAQHPHYTVTGIEDPEKMQNEIATLCRQQFNVMIRPDLDIIQHEGKTIILVYIPEALPHEKPIFITSKGIEKGTFRRIGPTDQLCTREDINYLYQQSANKKYDEMVREDAHFEDFDPTAIAAYRQMRYETNGSAEELKYNDQDLMKALSLLVSNKGGVYPTVAGLILFGKSLALRRLFPMSTRVDYIMIEGRTWVPDPDNRYHTIEIREGLLTAIPRLLHNIMQDIPQAFLLDRNELYRKDNPTIPRKVIREALCNALMHRDYTVDRPVQIRRYANRIEFENAGYSLKPEDQLGLPGSITRNNKIATILHEVNLAETKGTGIRAMRDAMREANLTSPLIESERSSNQFALTLLAHHLFDKKDIEWLAQYRHLNLNDEQARALIVVREMGAITNADYRAINAVDTLTASNHLRSLRDWNLVAQKGSGSKTYYIPSLSLITPDISPVTPDISPVTPDISPVTPDISPVTPDISPVTPDISPVTPDISLTHLPNHLREEIMILGKRVKPEKMRKLIHEICKEGYAKPSDLARLLNRDAEYLRRHYLTPMVESGELTYRYPDQTAHPQQAYQTMS